MVQNGDLKIIACRNLEKRRIWLYQGILDNFSHDDAKVVEELDGCLHGIGGSANLKGDWNVNVTYLEGHVSSEGVFRYAVGSLGGYSSVMNSETEALICELKQSERAYKFVESTLEKLGVKKMEKMMPVEFDKACILPDIKEDFKSFAKLDRKTILASKGHPALYEVD
jgi:hypothetical protein